MEHYPSVGGAEYLMPTPAMPSSGDYKYSTRTTNGTMVTVPAGRVLVYDLSITNSITVTGSGNTTITFNGTGAEIPDGTVLLQCVCAGIALTSVGTNTAYISGVIKAGANDCTVSFATSGTSSATGTLSGYLL